MINVLIVEDSAVVREFLTGLMSADPEIQIVAVAGDGLQAINAVKKYRPDVITMDIDMPIMDGLEATRRIMETQPTPIVIVSGSIDPRETATTFRALEAGALAVLARPNGIGHPDYESMTAELLRTVKTMAEVKVVRRWSKLRHSAPLPELPSVKAAKRPTPIKLIAIGASTGGPPVLQLILSALPRNYPLPIVIVQHMTPGFMLGFIDWLSSSISLPIKLAENGDILASSYVYVAPDGLQFKIERGEKIVLHEDAPEHNFRPSVSYLFRSLTENYGSSVAACLLTGMGRDGAWELRLLREKGALTIAQDEASSTVFGMPGEAVRMGAAKYVLPPEKIAALLVQLAVYR